MSIRTLAREVLEQTRKPDAVHVPAFQCLERGTVEQTAQVVDLNRKSCSKPLGTKPQPVEHGTRKADMFSCAHCGKRETPNAVIYPFGYNPATWLHSECWRDWRIIN